MRVWCHVVHPDHHRAPGGFRGILKNVLQSVGNSRDHVTFVLCRDSMIRRLHREFLNRDASTDVISFDLSGEHWKVVDSRLPRDDTPSIVGEIYVNLDRVRLQALEYQVTFWEELIRLSIHGLLHLYGFDDQDPADRGKMMARQEELLQKFWRPLHW